MEEYKFKKYDISSTDTTIENKVYEYGVDYDFLSKEEESLIRINSHLWSPQKIQELINEGLALRGEDFIEYQVEGGHLGIVIYTNEVYFFNLSNENEYEDFKWLFEKFINFLKQFKQFMIENS